MFKQFTKFGSLKLGRSYSPVNPFLLERFADTIHYNAAIYRQNMTPFIFWKRVYQNDTPKTSYRDAELAKLSNTLNVFGRPYLWSVFQNISPDSHSDKDMLVYRSWIDYTGYVIQGLTIVEDVSKDMDMPGVDPSNLGQTYSGYYESIDTPDWWPESTDYDAFRYAEKIEQGMDVFGRITIKCVGLK